MKQCGVGVQAPAALLERYEREHRPVAERRVSTLDWFGADYVVMLCADGDEQGEAWRRAVAQYRQRGFPIGSERMRHAAHTPSGERRRPEVLLGRYLPVA